MQKNLSSGFILIIVLGMLGVLAALALNLADQSKITAGQAVNTKARTTAKLAARSGIEAAIHHFIGNQPTNSTLEGTRTLSVETSTDLHRYSFTIKDSSSAINLNDGLAAGKAELGTLFYAANAVDPWPTNDINDVEESAWINLRLRRLLDAFGDVNKFTLDIGLPEWRTGVTDPNYNVTAFAPTGDSFGNRGASQPENTGLGAAIISQRPPQGYKTVDEVKNIINSWADTHGLTSQLNGRTFFDLVSVDFTTSSWVDTEFSRMTREFGASWNSDTKNSLVQMSYLDENPPDLTTSGLFRPHPHPPINLNAASTHAKAAVFAALANVSYSCEGAGIEQVVGGGAFAGPNYYVGRPSIGAGGVVFKNVEENGFDGAGESLPNSFMSVMDSLVLAQALEDHITTNGSIQSFNQFEQALVAVRATKRDFERANAGVSTNYPMSSWSVIFDQAYVEKTLPHVLSPIRCLPAWLHAPVATLRPYAEQNYGNMLNNNVQFALRSVEDFVFRSQLPKVTFFPGGEVSVHSTGIFKSGMADAKFKIDAQLKLFERKQLRSQEQFVNATDVADSSSDLKIGPEPTGTANHQFLGVVGLKDTNYISSGNRPYSIALPFEDDLNDLSAGAENFGPQDPATDTFSYDDTSGAPEILQKLPQAYESVYPYPFTMTGKAFDADFLDAVRNSTPTDDRTWKRLNSPTTIFTSLMNEDWFLRSKTVPGVPLPTTEAGMLNYMNTYWSALTGNSPHPGAGSTLEQFMWAYSVWRSASSTTWKNHWELPSTWSNGPPMNPITFVGADRRYLSPSQMEDGTFSMFDAGANGSNLSPFGGLSFSSAGHGPRATVPFSDSLYFRPAKIMGLNRNDTASQATGAYFNKAMISMWYRKPTGYSKTFAAKFLMSLTLWHSTEEFYNPPGAPLVGIIAKDRPTEFQLILGDNGPALQQVEWLPGGGPSPMWERADWSQEVNLPTLSMPFSWPLATNPPTDPGITPNHLMITRPWSMLADENYWLNRWSEYAWNTGVPYASMTTGAGGRKDRLGVSIGSLSSNRLPGTWNRVTVGWNSEPNQNETGHNYFGDFNDAAMTGGGAWFPSENEQMLLTFGEQVHQFRGSNSATWRQNLGGLMTPALTGLNTPQFVSVGRLNSLIDNIDVRFGDTGGVTHNTDTAAGTTISEFFSNDPSFSPKRYNLTLLSEGPSTMVEPLWSLNPNLPEGSKLLALFARTYDVPEADPDSNAPWVELTVASAIPLNKILSTDPGTSSPFKSQEIVVYDGAVSHENDLRVNLVYKATDPNGALYLKDKLWDIPWIKEVGWAWLPKEGYKVKSWIEH